MVKALPLIQFKIHVKNAQKAKGYVPTVSIPHRMNLNYNLLFQVSMLLSCENVNRFFDTIKTVARANPAV